MNEENLGGAPGCAKTPRGFGFSLYSENAEKVELCLFDEHGERELARQAMRRDGNFYRAELGLGKENLCYGFRAHGPWRPGEGKLFNPNKLLLDPFARKTRGAFRLHPSVFAHIPTTNGKDRKLVFNPVDSAPFVPKGVIGGAPEPLNVKRGSAGGRLPGLIYEAGVHRFTDTFPNLPDRLRGKYGGFCHPRVMDYLKSLGVGSVLLEPVQFRLSSLTSSAVDSGFSFAGGALSFFAPDPALAAGEAFGELSAMIAGLRANGFRVILDMPFDRSAEAGVRGPHLSLKGIDNEVYFLPGGGLNPGHPAARMLCRESLKHWKNLYGADGFRFRRAASLLLPPAMEGPGFFEDLRSEPELRDATFIVDPRGPGGGPDRPEAFEGCLKYDDAFGLEAGKYWGGQSGALPGFSRGFGGGGAGRKKVGFGSSLNFASARESPGHDSAEAETAEGAKSRSIGKCLLATLIFSVGSPLLRGGEEREPSRFGVEDGTPFTPDWTVPDPSGSDFLKTLREAAAARAAMEDAYPRSVAEAGKLWKWLNAEGEPMTETLWWRHAAKAVALAAESRRGDEAFCFCFNPGESELEFLPPRGRAWASVLFSTLERPPEVPSQTEAAVRVSPKSLSLFRLTAAKNPDEA